MFKHRHPIIGSVTQRDDVHLKLLRCCTLRTYITLNKTRMRHEILIAYVNLAMSKIIPI